MTCVHPHAAAPTGPRGRFWVYFRFYLPRHVLARLPCHVVPCMGVGIFTYVRSAVAARVCHTDSTRLYRYTCTRPAISLNPERGSNLNLNPEVSSRGGMATVQVGLKPRGAHSQPECKRSDRMPCRHPESVTVCADLALRTERSQQGNVRAVAHMRDGLRAVARAAQRRGRGRRRGQR